MLAEEAQLLETAKRKPQLRHTRGPIHARHLALLVHTPYLRPDSVPDVVAKDGSGLLGDRIVTRAAGDSERDCEEGNVSRQGATYASTTTSASILEPSAKNTASGSNFSISTPCLIYGKAFIR